MKNRAEIKARGTLRNNVAQWAHERAIGDLAFCGEAPFAMIPPGERQKIKDALAEYARRGAQEAFDGLLRHGHIKL